MPALQVYDPAMCCSTGVCGPDVDSSLVQFASDLKWLAARGVTVERFNLGQEPQAFAGQPAVRSAIEEGGIDVLPLILIDGRIAAHSRYPTREELIKLAGISETPTQSALTPAVTEIVAIAAAVAAGSDAAFRRHVERAEAQGLSREDLIQVVNMALAVREQPVRELVETAREMLIPDGANGCAPGSGCC
jgi:alkylhydroperoxidase/carboxymuconolactone decarboxylase family protein YurZ